MEDKNQNAVETTVGKAETDSTTPDIASLEARIKALEGENEKLKQANSNASSDAAEWKKKFRSTQDEAQRAEAERAEMIERIQKENAELKRNQLIATQNAEWLSIGMNADMAKKAAEATADNDFAALMDVMKQFITEHDKALNAKAIKDTPAPVGGPSSQSVTAEQFSKMGYQERVKLFTENPELYKELTK